VTVAERAFRYSQYDNRCAYCGASGKMTDDHLTPITNRGGENVIENIVPACASCNSRKNQLTACEFIFKRAGWNISWRDIKRALKRKEVAA
jgi:5-methylcytosine-specific restriction endonuclease McrA